MKCISKLMNILARHLVSYLIEKASFPQYVISIKILLQILVFQSAELCHFTGLTFSVPNELISLLKTSTVILVDNAGWL